MKSKLLLLAASACLAIPVVTFAAPLPPPMRESVAVCDPAFPNNCAKPNSSGQLPVTTGSGTASQQVQGAGAAGSALVGFPVRVGVSDGVNTQNVSSPGGISDGNSLLSGVAVGVYGWNGATWDRFRSILGVSTAGTGVLAAGLVSIFSATPSVLTDGQYSTVNITARHALQVAHVATDGVITASSGNVANANAVATLAAGGASKTTYITGFQCTASGSTIGLAVNLTVAGVVTGTMTYTFVFTAGVLTEAPILNVSYPNPIPASALNTAITVTLPAGGTGNTNAACNAQGYQL